MEEVRDARTARDAMTRRASVVAGVFTLLTEGMPVSVAARELARRGVPVFPCAPGGKRPIPERSFHEASLDGRQVELWWRERPRANLALPTGAASGVVVVDVDVHGVNGHIALARAARSGMLSESLATVSTPTGGRHLYFPADPEREQRSWQVGRAGIDFRGDGGYIIVPPSLRVLDGRWVPYRVEAVTTGPVTSLDAQRLRDFLDPRPTYVPVPEP
ncbi:DNA primase, partial [Propionibacterium freudenreichii]|nr:DNA primase [Propionibacterium freudenreichii]